MSVSTPTAEDITLAKAAARATCAEYDLLISNGEDPLAALGWAMGERIAYERALVVFAKHAAHLGEEVRSTPVPAETDELVATYRRAKQAAIGDSNDDEISILWELVEDLMTHAGIETD